MRNLALLLCSCALVGFSGDATLAAADEEPGAGAQAAAAQPKPRIQMAILLDSSSSMGGLIRQAQAHLWKVVNEFALARKGGEPAELEVALYEYGKNTLPAPYVRHILPLTDNLDKASEELFRLKANTIPGGDEYAGKVILAATKDLKWSESHADLKVIFIAGNESFAQGDVDYRDACKAAITRGIMVNTIYCGAHATGVSLGWKDGALRADGSYTSIDQDRAVAYIAAPQDNEIRRLGEDINRTYVPYGQLGTRGSLRQSTQDRKAAELGEGVRLERYVSKGSALYKNVSWDLVDAVKGGTVRLETLKKEDLPKEMRELDLEAKKAYIEKKSKERAQIQLKIQELDKARKKYLSQQQEKAKRPGAAAGRTLDEAIIEILRKQAKTKQFQLK